MTTQEESSGRENTLDPIETIGTGLQVQRVDSTISCGFRVGWFSGETDDGHEYELTVGAGVGSQWLTMKVDGKRYRADMAEWFEAFVREVIDDPD